MKNIIWILLMVIAISASAQVIQPKPKFETKFNVPLADSLKYDVARWVDFDNDSLLDVMVSGKNSSGAAFFSIFKNDTIHGPVHTVLLNTDFKDHAFHLLDYDGDNRIDILVSGTQNGNPETVVYRNNGDFAFQLQPIMMAGGSTLALGDLDEDGTPEMVVSGTDANGPFFNIYKQTSSSWNLVSDSIKIHALSVQILDLGNDADGVNDLYISGLDKDQKPFSRLYSNKRLDFKFKPSLYVKAAGQTAVADLNNDGAMDVILSGKDSLGNSYVMRVGNKCSGGCFGADTISHLSNAKVFVGDLNSNGTCDLSMFGTSGIDTLNLIRLTKDDYDTLGHKHVNEQTFGDYDRDGDLDLVQIAVDDGVSTLIIQKNKTAAKNLPPSSVTNPIAIKMFGYLFMFWGKSSDDHTYSRSLTYDVTIQDGAFNMYPTHDYGHGKRLLVNHGNVGMANFLILKTDSPGEVSFSIQAVDNAYHAGYGGLCTGSGSSGCFTKETKNIYVCKGENAVLSTPASSIWYSLKSGVLGFTSSHQVTSSRDTVFALTPDDGSGCARLTVFMVRPLTKPIKVTEPARYICSGGQLTLDDGIGWETVQWRSKNKGFLSSNKSIVFSTQQNDSVVVLLEKSTGCALEKTIPIIISKPVLTLESNAYQILKGESIQLKASGGKEYDWSPATDLDNPAIATPIASPIKTIEYTVTMTDSIGCVTTGKVLVMVEETAFIPTLFTPNDDGKNDELRGYGIGTVSDFNFSIYNREGNLVYSTSNAAELSNSGWNGTSNGVKQPAGIYYWKVTGKNNIGRAFNLNGKSSGSVMLIR